jgi:pSer/pThr/pTyr-binding forkhead associated (FHA) protein
LASWILESTDDETPMTLRLPAGSVKTLGRTARADFIVDASLVSRLHCRLTAGREGQLVVEDLDSTNGTQVNGTRVSRAELVAGDTLQVGRVTFQIKMEAGSWDPA